MDWSEGLKVFGKWFPDSPIDSGEEPPLDSGNLLPSPCPLPPSGGSRFAPSLYWGRLPLGSGPRGGWFWCPEGLPEAHPVAIASSRLGRAAPENPRVARALRAFFCGLCQGEAVVTAGRTTLDEAVGCGARLFGTPIVRLIPFPRSLSSIAGTMRRRTVASRREYRIYFDRQQHSDRDRLMLACCSQVKLISVRQKGNMLAALRDLMLLGDRRPRVLLLADEKMTSATVREELHALGCQDWWLWDEEAKQDALPSSTEDIEEHCADIVDLEQLPGDWLSHWTRAGTARTRSGMVASPWEAALLGRQAVSGPMATLCRILASQTIAGGTALVRGGRPMCCFTEVPLDEFASRRVFRPHLSRWDFEPYGIAVRRSVLERLGGRPVQYVTPDAIRCMDADEQVWSVPDDGTGRWREEREWRVSGNVDLRKLSANEAVVFVPSADEAELAARLSRWPVTIIRSATKQQLSRH